MRSHENELLDLQLIFNYIKYKGRSESTGRNQIISNKKNYLIFIFVMRLDPVPASIDTSKPALVQLVEAGSEEFSRSVMNPLAYSGGKLL